MKCVRKTIRGTSVPQTCRRRGAALTLPGGEPISLGELRAAHEGWLPRYMGA